MTPAEYHVPYGGGKPTVDYSHPDRWPSHRRAQATVLLVYGLAAALVVAVPLVTIWLVTR